MKKLLARKYRSAAVLGAAAALLALELWLAWGWMHAAVPLAPAVPQAAPADELAALVDAVNTTLPRLAQRLQAHAADTARDRSLLAEYSAQAVQGAEPSMELSQLMAEGLAVVTVGHRRPAVLLGERTIRVGDVLPDGSRVSAIDRHGLTTTSAQGAKGRLQGFAALPMPAASVAAPSAPELESTNEVSK